MANQNGQVYGGIRTQKGYYITAYAIAVKHGFSGTEEEWLASLKGEEGTPTEMRYNEELEQLEWKLKTSEEWTGVLPLSEIRGEAYTGAVKEIKELRDHSIERVNEAAGSAINLMQERMASAEENIENAKQYTISKIEDIRTVTTGQMEETKESFIQSVSETKEATIKAMHDSKRELQEQINQVKVSAEQSLESLREGTLSDIAQKKNEGISLIQDEKANTLQEIQSKKAEVLSEANEVKSEAVQTVNAARDEVLSNVSQAREQISTAQTTVSQAIEEIGQAKVEVEQVSAGIAQTKADIDSARQMAEQIKSNIDSAKQETINARDNARQSEENARSSAQSSEQNKMDILGLKSEVQNRADEVAIMKREVTTLKQGAEESTNIASAGATESKSWAVGGTGTREGEETNNARYWASKAKAIVNPIEIVNSLTDSSSDKALSAAQGQILGLALQDVTEKADQAFQSASNGKKAIAAAVTGKGVAASESDTFQKLAEKIEKIESGPDVDYYRAITRVGEDGISESLDPVDKGIVFSFPSSTEAILLLTMVGQVEYIPGDEYGEGTEIGVENPEKGATVKYGNGNFNKTMQVKVNDKESDAPFYSSVIVIPEKVDRIKFIQNPGLNMEEPSLILLLLRA